MDVRLPDGTIIRNVPEGTTKAQLTEKLAANGYDIGRLAPVETTATRENVQPERGALYRDEIKALAAPFAGFSKGVGNVMFGGQELVAKGLQKLGATETAQALIEDAARRRAEQETFITPYREAAPGMTRGGEFTGEVVSTLPVGGVIAKSVQPISAPLAQAIRTGGFSTGAPAATTVGGKVVDAATRAAGGGIVGGTSAALISPEDTTTGVVFGAALPFAAPYVAKGAQKVGETVSNVAGKVLDMRQIPAQKAANILRESIGGSVDDVVNALRNAKPGQTPAQALADAGLNEPVAQALLKRMSERDPKFFTDLIKNEDFKTANALAKIAGGSTATESRVTLENMKNALNTMTGPQREAALSRANLGKAVAEYEAEAGKLGVEAAEQVQKVRDLISAGKSAEAWARLQMIKKDLPVGAARYTYADELAQKAFNEWSDAAAKGSLDLGQGARMAQAAADTLRKFGVKPLTGESITSAINAKLTDPRIGPNKDVASGLKMVADDIAEWTSNGGVIDAQALHTIRKSVNTRIQSLMPGADVNAQKRLAAKVMAEVNPLIDNAIEQAGGAGWKKYLADYSKGMQNINARKLSGEARRLYNESPELFVRLVNNESPEVVEKFMGPGNYDLAVELSQDVLGTLKGAAKQITTRAEMAKQATAGENALVELLGEHASILKIPNWFDPRITTTNKALDILEQKIGKAVRKKLTEAAKDVATFEELLNTLPASERNKVLKTIRDPKIWQSLGEKVGKAVPEKARGGVTAGAVNALTGEEQENTNALAR